MHEEVELVSVSHELTKQGGLNIKYVDDVALVPSEVSLDDGLRDDLTSLNFKIVELGENQFSYAYKAGVKCRSLAIDWVRREEL